MKRIIRFGWRYRLFSLACLAAIIGGGLSLAGHTTIANWILGIISLIAVIPTVIDMWGDFRSGRYGIDILALTAIITSVALHQFWAAIVIVIMLTGGESLEDYAERRAKSELTSLLKHAPQIAHRLRGSKTVDIAASEVQAGDKLIIETGELVPADAVILEGEANLDESSLTGESLPQAKGPGDQILSGSINLDGVLTVRASHAAKDSQYEQIIRLVRAASSSQAPFVRLADRYSIPFTVAAYAIAAAAWIVGHHAIRFLEVIVVATPCPLLLAAPIALVSGMSRASREGIIVRTGGALEQLAVVRTVAFDKTGTLTVGQPRFTGIKTYAGHEDDEVLAIAAGLEQGSNHVLAQVIVQAARARNIKPAKARHVREAPGHGLSAQIRGRTMLAGSFDFMQQNNVAWPASLKKTPITRTVSYVAIDGHLAGVLSFDDQLRPEAKIMLNRLSDLGVARTLMITGDNEPAARQIAKQLGISDFSANALPADKLHAIEQIDERPVAFVGDGVNDAPVLTAADVGVALGARGSTAASESADIVIMQDSLDLVARALEISQRTLNVAKQSIVGGIALSLVLMIVYATGRFSPVSGAILQEVVDVIVIFNALRAHRVKVASRPASTTEMAQ